MPDLGAIVLSVGVGDLLVRVLHDNGGSDEYRPKREDESWYAWWRAYENDVLLVAA